MKNETKEDILTDFRGERLRQGWPRQKSESESQVHRTNYVDRAETHTHTRSTAFLTLV